MRTRPSTWLGVLLIFAPCIVRAQSPAPRVDSIFAPWDRTNSPGCALGVMQDGRLVYSRGYGMANLDWGVPNSPRNAYYVGSVSKQFTAASIALLAQRGSISLDDDVRRYVPELPDYGKPIRVSDLVHHMSGLRDIYVLMDLAGIRMEDVFPDDEALSLIAAQKELNFEPGTDYLYSNSGYWILGQIVERVTGESLRVFAQREIFDPLGMTHSHFHDDPGHVMERRVTSYAPSPGGGFRVADLPNFDKIGAGGLYTTIEDLLRWDDNFYSGAMGGRAFLDLMHTRGVLARGDTLGYAFGLNVGRYRGLRTVEHGGSLMGFRAELLRFPDQHFTVAILCNLASITPGGLAQRVAEVFLGDRMAAAPVADRPPVQRERPGPAAVTGPLDVYAGRFHSEEVRVTYTVTLAGGDLTLSRPTQPPARLVATGPDAFRAGGLGLRFMREGDRITAFTVEAGRVRNIRFERIR